jgi:hypothetical protein
MAVAHKAFFGSANDKVAGTSLAVSGSQSPLHNEDGSASEAR